MKTTKAHFEYFQKRVRYWYKRYNLNGWQLYFGHEDIGNNYARVAVNMIGRVATFYLTPQWAHQDLFPLKKVSIDGCARHEVIHLIVGPLGALMNARFVTQDEAITSEETVIRHLEELL